MVTAAMKSRRLLLGRKTMTSLDSILKCKDITLPTKVHNSQGHGLSSSDVWMSELDQKESRTLKNGCFCIVMLEKTLESPSIARRSKRPTLKEINLEYSLERLMLKLKL